MGHMVTKKTIEGKDYLYISFGEKLTQEDAESIIDQWNLYESENAGSVNHIWDCNQFKGFDQAARRLWQGKLKESKDKTGVIWLISDSMMIKSAARIVGTFANVNIKPVSTLDKVA